MQFLKRFPFFLVAVVVLLSTFTPVASAVDDGIGDRLFAAMSADPPMPLFEDDDTNYGISVMALTGAQIYADNSLFAFGQAFKKVHETGVFIYHENLPYGLSTGIISFRCNYSIWNIYFNANDASALCFGNGANIALRVLFLSNSSYYISRFSVETGKYQTFNGAQGMKSYAAGEVLDYVTTTNYTDFYITISSNVYVTNTDGTIESGLYYYGDNVEFFEPVWYQYSYLTYAKYQADKLSSTINSLSEQNQENYEALSEQQSSYAAEAEKQASSIAASQEAADASRQSEQMSQNEEHHEETGNWISNLGDRISGFFDSLKNYLLYFQETEPEHVNPFAGILDSVQSFFDEQMGDTAEFKNSMSDTLDNVKNYIQKGSGIIDGILTGVPILNAFVVFFLLFFVVRKVVGR